MITTKMMLMIAAHHLTDTAYVMSGVSHCTVFCCCSIWDCINTNTTTHLPQVYKYTFRISKFVLKKYAPLIVIDLIDPLPTVLSVA